MKIEFNSHPYEEQFKSLVLEVYRQGYNDAKAEAKHSITFENQEFVDLGLPSGTLWSCPISHFDYGHKLAMFTYEEAIQLEVPTVEQFQELLDNCRVNGLLITGPNSAKIGYSYAPVHNPYLIYNKGEGTKGGRNMFWLKSEPNNRHESKTMTFDRNILEFGEHFIGFKLPIFLVKQP